MVMIDVLSIVNMRYKRTHGQGILVGNGRHYDLGRPLPYLSNHSASQNEPGML